MEKNFFDAVSSRRSFYAISKESTSTDDRIKEVLEHAIKHTPSAFNSQSARIVLLHGEHHNKLWEITKDALKSIVPSDQFAATEDKINSFKNGYATVLFFEDMKIIENLQTQFALYKDNFPVWSQQSNGMHQYVVWTSLEIEGFGASLQHYNELIENQIKKEWNIQSSWKLIAQMPFGKPLASPDNKQFMPIEDRLKIIK